ncbi:MAG TPA: substrate-binding domain-containing protein [Gemmatimonadales bacterium]|nr:substrate-binding domain-containing protein [Gemmatimonadales bacterium]
MAASRFSRLVGAAALLAAAIAPGLAAQNVPANPDVILATTTSLYDTGLLDSIVPIFARETGYHVRVVAVGSGEALAMGRRGDADVVFVHSPAAESAFMAGHYGVSRRIVATNYFTIVGPADDPAHVRAAPTAAEALRRIFGVGAGFVSRGDSSGTNARELALWRKAGVKPAWPGYIETGQGMAATLLVASQRRAYTLSDRATFGLLKPHLDLVALREKDRDLVNIYHVIELNPAGHPRMNVAGGNAFADFVVSEEMQRYLARFGTAQFGEPLFVPAWGKEPE